MSSWRISAVVIAFTACSSSQVWAQQGLDTTKSIKSIPSLAVEATKQTLLDPTTYAPAGLLYVSSRLDWNSSQVFFAHGDVEQNPRYTISGLPHDTPLSYSQGNKQLLTDALSVASVSAVNNVIAHFTIDAMAAHSPEHAHMWKTLGWIERTAVASSISYMLSAQHFRQWETNRRLAAERGY
jgi:hypothetical protein